VGAEIKGWVVAGAGCRGLGVSRYVRRGIWTAAIASVLASVSPALAVREIATEENIADLLATPMLSLEEAEEAAKQRQWAILPEIGYDPESGGDGGLKFTHRNIAGTGATLDVEATYALNSQESLSAVFGTPHLLGDRFLTLLEADYYYDPSQKFFGLGNNDIGPDPASTQAYERYEGTLTAGWRPRPDLALDVTFGVRHLRIGRGQRDNGFPFTLDAFPDLSGVGGGFVSPFGASLVWTTRDDVLRPTRGWRVILKATHTDRAVLSDFEFTRLDADIGYLIPLVPSGRHVLGVRLNGGLIAGPPHDVPFWELEALGGDDTFRGFFPHRFLGSQRMFVNTEYRFPIAGFNFFHLWYVDVGGAVFGDSGRVFMSPSQLESDFGLSPSSASHLVSTFQYDYGLGIRFAVARAILARVEVGFSEEEKGLVYLAFGQAF
jgi:outer membrane protein assembly factor BamA